MTFAHRYPFGADLNEVVAGADEWSRHLAALAETANDRLAATAGAIRLQIDRLDERGDLDRHYEDTMRDALGGVWGDVAAAFHSGVQVRLANLLDAISSDAAPAAVREHANDLCHSYLDARTRDDHSTSRGADRP